MGPESRFFRAAAYSFCAGLAAQATQIAARLGETPKPDWMPDAVHLLVVGAGGLTLLGLLVRAEPALAPDPDFKKGAAPRSYWIFLLGLALYALVGPYAPRSTFLSALTLAGVLLELAAVVMLLLAKRS